MRLSPKAAWNFTSAQTWNLFPMCVFVRQSAASIVDFMPAGWLFY
jgi:hypothetical protein